MYQTLYRKYRPTSFDDVYGQDHITTVLKEQIRKDKVSHAYLFCGSRGTGKTTCAKILAKAVNCPDLLEDGNPCNKCDSCVDANEGVFTDIVELDAASNNGVDNIRELCDELMFLPARGKKRVYIIDEVHMLSPSAFNALLKTLEEPPEHVLFILATTELHKVPATITSRCQRFDFKRIPVSDIIKRIMQISAEEGIRINRDAASVIAKLSDGAMRDALSLLEACTGYDGEIDGQVITDLLGVGSRELILDITEAIAAKNTARAISLLSELYEQSAGLKQTMSDILAVLRDLLVIKTVPSPDKYLDCYESELAFLKETAERMTSAQIYFCMSVTEDLVSTYDRLTSGKKTACEIALIRMCDSSLDESYSALNSRLSAIEDIIKSGKVIKETVSVEPKAEKKEKILKANTPKITSETPVKSENATENSDKSYKDTDKLKAVLLRRDNIKSFVNMLSFECDGKTLVAKATDFALGVLKASGFENILADAVKDVSPYINDIRLEVVTEKTETDNKSDLDELI